MNALVNRGSPGLPEPFVGPGDGRTQSSRQPCPRDRLAARML